MTSLGPSKKFLRYTRNKFGPIAICDESGQAYMHSKRKNQDQYAGYTVVDTGKIVNPVFYDIPNPQSMPTPFYGDPKPVLFSKPPVPQEPSPIQISGGGTYVNTSVSEVTLAPVLVNTSLTITDEEAISGKDWNYSGGCVLITSQPSTALDFIGIQAGGSLIMQGANLYFNSTTAENFIGSIDSVFNGTLGLPLKVNFSANLSNNIFIASNRVNPILQNINFATLTNEPGTRAIEYTVSTIANPPNGENGLAYKAGVAYSTNTSVSYVNVS